MTVLVTPPLDEEPWPTLGPQVCDFIETNLVHGPGDIRGQQATIDHETRGLIYRAYEVYPRDHPQAGRRRFKRVGISLRKGTAKTEKAAWLAAVELHDEGPVRCDGWKKVGGVWQPVGAPVTDPYIPMVAYTEEQTEDLAYGALYVIVSEGPLADDFDIGLERIMRKGGDGKAQALASAPDSRDGARTTFQHFDETHRFVLPRLRDAHQTMQANIPKRKAADAWTLETTTAPVPGEGSVAEGTMEYARQVAEGEIKDARLFFFHRQASEDHELDTAESVREAIIEASGPAAEWSDVDGILDLWRDPQTDKAYFERVWLNLLSQQTRQAFDGEQFNSLAERREVEAGEIITLGFDGSKTRDSSALIATHVESGYQWPLGIWERPPKVKMWEVPVEAIDAAVDEAFEQWQVWRLYADPFYWETTIESWAGRYGADRVHEWRTNRRRQMAEAVQAYGNAINDADLSHSGDARLKRHIGNARRKDTKLTDTDGNTLYVLGKDYDDSPLKIDAAVAAVLSWEARGDAVAKGVRKSSKVPVPVF